MKTSAGKEGESGVAAPLGEIPRKLKEYYDSLQDEAIPEKFLDLLERLDRAERSAMGATMEPEVSLAGKESQ